MRYFTLCLYSEGPSDRYFLEKLVWRTLISMLSSANDECEVQEQFIRFPKKPSDMSRQDYIVSQITKLSREITIAFVHGDGGTSPAKARTNNCLPATDRINAEFDNLCGVPIVPVRETEAWALADQDAIREVTRLRNYVLPMADVEKIPDPKAVIRGLTKESRSLGSEAVLLSIADICSLARLRTLDSFIAFEGDLRDQLRRMAVIN